jgi:hypothetical protein
MNNKKFLHTFTHINDATAWIFTNLQQSFKYEDDSMKYQLKVAPMKIERVYALLY